MIIAVDIDEVCVDVIPVWFDWLKTFQPTPLSLADLGYPYNLSDTFSGLDGGMDFWSTPHLYQKLKPKEGSVEVLSWLHKQGHKVGFVTYCKKAHLSSKCKFIKEHFPFYSFINATKEKGYTRCDVLIDDRNKYLNQMPAPVVCVKMATPYTQCEELLDVDTIVADGWLNVKEKLCNVFQSMG